MLLDTNAYHYELDTVSNTTGWVCGLGHGITKTTPTENVKHFVETVRRKFS
jgi:uroporphyrinogen-III decarboxylase